MLAPPWREVEQLCLLIGKLLVCADGREHRLRGEIFGIHGMNVHTLVIIVAALDLIGAAHYRRHTRKQLNRLTQDIFD